jgi:S-adenosylmethionine decarboxylase
MASYLDCDPAALRNLAGLRKTLREAALACGATIMGWTEHIYQPQGYTLILMLSESHTSLHTYPEHNACFVDLFTCGTRCHPEPFDAVLREYLRPASFEAKVLLRSRQSIEEPFNGGCAGSQPAVLEAAAR